MGPHPKFDMDESVDTESVAAGKSDDSRKCISQKSAKFSIDSLLATNEKAQVRSDLNVIEDVRCADYETCIRTESLESDPIQGSSSEQSLTEETVKKESDVVSTTEGFYHRNFGEGNAIKSN